jgi:hypothetical protein
VADYFTPYNQPRCKTSDADLGSGGPLLLPDSAGSAAHPHLIVGAGKEGKIYLLDRDNMGHYNTDGQWTTARSCRKLPGAIRRRVEFARLLGTIAFITGQRRCDESVSHHQRRYRGHAGIASPPPALVFPAPRRRFRQRHQQRHRLGDPIRRLSQQRRGGVARLQRDEPRAELYNSSQNLARDNPGGAVKMTRRSSPAAKFMSARNTRVGLWPGDFSDPRRPFRRRRRVHQFRDVALADATAGVSIYYTLDGTTPTTGSTLYTGPFNLTSNALVQAIAIAPGAVNSAVASASFINTAAAGNGTGLLGAIFHEHTSAAIRSPARRFWCRRNATINFNWGTTGPSPVVGSTNFTVRWTGSVQPQFNETYTFLHHRRRRRAALHQRPVADQRLGGQNQRDDQDQQPSRSIPQQFYNIELDYYQKTNNASVRWRGAVLPRRSSCRRRNLYPFTNPPPTSS